MTQSNKRRYAPPREADPRREARAPGANGYARPAQQARRTPAASMPRNAQPGPAAPRRAISLRGSDLPKVLIIGAIMIALACGLQIVWPNGFPLQVNTQSTLAMQSQVSEIYSAGPLRINEIMAGNRTTLRLADNTSPDWIEVANIGSSTVQLEGYTLARTADDARSFTFPALTLEAGECVLVYADSRMQADAGDALHAPFRLSSAGDTLMLFNAGGTAIDTINVAALPSDQSYARMDIRSWQACETPTPGLSNTRESYLALQQPVGGSPVVLSELMSNNVSILADEKDQYYDYVELRNNSGAPVDLTGWYLSDDTTKLRKWCFPACSLGAGEYMVVHASKLNRTDDPAHLHANFSLSSEGEVLLLVSPDGRIMDRVDFDLLRADQAYSLASDGSWTTALAPSPGRANG